MVNGDVYNAVLKKALGFYYKESVSEYEKEVKNICYCKKRNRYYVNESFVSGQVAVDLTNAKKKRFCKKPQVKSFVFCIKK